MTLESAENNGFMPLTTKTKSSSISEVIREGIVTLSASQAGAVERELRYEQQQRDRNNVGAAHIASLSDDMKTKVWRPKDAVNFAQLPDGRLILVDGHHRMRAQALSGVSIQWVVVIHPCDSDDDVAKLYCTFNTKERRRSTNTILGALGIAEDIGIKREVLKCMFQAMPLIACGFDLAARDAIFEKSIDRRVTLAESYKREIVSWDIATKGSAWALKKKLLAGGPLAIALVTFRQQPGLAKQFWGGIAQNDGLPRLDPRHTYLRYLNGEFVSSKNGKSEQPIRYAASAWNAFVDGDTPKFFKVNEQIDKRLPIRIAGTSFDR